MATSIEDRRSTTEERPAGAPPAPGRRRRSFAEAIGDAYVERKDGPVTMRERWRAVGLLLVGALVALPVGAIVHRISGELEVDRQLWITLAVGFGGTAVLSFCFPRWRRFPTRESRPGDWPRTPVQKAMAVVLLVVLVVAVVVIGYFRLAD